MRIRTNSLVCLQNHCFDLSKTGVVHLLRSPVKKASYDQALFESRNVVYRQGLYQNMIKELSLFIRPYLPNKEFIYLLDAGCGEGSHLFALSEILRSWGVNLLSVGIDLAKKGIRLAAKNYPDHIWCVADLANCPFQDQSFDMILNILSPSRYAEFSRILHHDGWLVKVVPESGYLKELRSYFYQGEEKEVYSNQKVIAHFAKHFHILDQKRITYTEPINPTYLQHIIQMTPMTWGAEKEAIQKIMESEIDQITVDLTLIIGKKQGT